MNANELVIEIRRRVNDAGFRIDGYAAAYLGDGLSDSLRRYGLEGVLAQCPYIATNLRAATPEQRAVKKWLLDIRKTTTVK